jgi:hypothetical protein
MQFSLRWLFVAVAFVAISVVALLNANSYWAAITRSALLVVLSLAVVGAVFLDGRARAFWIGFEIVALFHFLLSGLLFSTPFAPLLSDEVIAWMHQSVAPIETTQVRDGDYFNGRPRYIRIDNAVPPREYFEPIARCVFIVLIGIVGGFVASWFYSRRESAKGSVQ